MMGDFSLEFIDPSELDEIKMGLETGIQENERRLTKARIIFIDKLELDEFRPSIFEREMEIIEPCIKRTSKYLNNHKKNKEKMPINLQTTKSRPKARFKNSAKTT